MPAIGKLFIAEGFLTVLSTSIVCEKESKEISKSQQEINLFMLLIYVVLSYNLSQKQKYQFVGIPYSFVSFDQERLYEKTFVSTDISYMR